MISTNSIPARSLQKSYKAIIEEVKTKKKAFVLTTHDTPQVALVLLEDLERLQAARANQSALALLQLAHDAKEELKDLPSDLRMRADEILYSV